MGPLKGGLRSLTAAAGGGPAIGDIVWAEVSPGADFDGSVLDGRYYQKGVYPKLDAVWAFPTIALLPSPTVFYSGYNYKIAGGDDWVVVSQVDYNGGTGYLSSYDLRTQVQAQVAIPPGGQTGYSINNIKIANGRLFCLQNGAVYRSTTNRNLTGFDMVTMPSPASPLYDVVFAFGLYIFATSDSGVYYTSPDLITFTRRTGAPFAVQTIFKKAGAFVYALGQAQNVYRTADGINWTKVTGIPNDNSSISDVAFGNGIYVLVSTAGNNLVYKSTDGTVFTSAGFTDIGTVYYLAWDGTRFVAHTTKSTNIVTLDPIAVTWATLMFTNGCSGIVMPSETSIAIGGQNGSSANQATLYLGQIKYPNFTGLSGKNAAGKTVFPFLKVAGDPRSIAVAVVTKPDTIVLNTLGPYSISVPASGLYRVHAWSAGGQNIGSGIGPEYSGEYGYFDVNLPTGGIVSGNISGWDTTSSNLNVAYTTATAGTKSGSLRSSNAGGAQAGSVASSGWDGTLARSAPGVAGGGVNGGASGSNRGGGAPSGTALLRGGMGGYNANPTGDGRWPGGGSGFGNGGGGGVLIEWRSAT